MLPFSSHDEVSVDHFHSAPHVAAVASRAASILLSELVVAAWPSHAQQKSPQNDHVHSAAFFLFLITKISQETEIKLSQNISLEI